jgi:malate dehydrogenase (oxaloacetate-decarboxylating)
MSEDIKKRSLDLHNKHKGKICVHSKVPIETSDDLALAYTPGVAEPSLQIAKDKSKVYDYTAKGNLVAVVSNGTAVLGLGDIGPDAAIPVMEGKAVLFRRFGGIDAFPVCIDEKDPYKLAEIIKKISPVFGGINLEDIKAPKCFIVEKIVRELNMPVMHDDQHGTAIVVLAALINATKVAGKDRNVKIVISGAGAAGIAISKLLLDYGFKSIILCDTKGAIYDGREEGMNFAKEEIAKLTNKTKERGKLADVIIGKDVFIGVSSPNLVTKEMVKTMNKDSIIFAMANPVPEIMPDEAKAGGAKVIATGRSDFPNQVNNVLAFPGVFKGALEIRARITEKMKLAAAEALAGMVKHPTAERIIPSVFDEGVAEKIADAVKKAA